jgi:cytochrome c oxidase subunit II
MEGRCRFYGGLVPLLAGAAAACAGQAMAQAPHSWQIGQQTPASPVAARIADLHTLVLWIITIITLFVAGLLIWVMYRFNSRRNPVPSHTSHNTLLEVAWTVVPVLILVVIAIPSFRLVYFEDRTAHADMTIKVTGHQWFWEYSYPDNGNVDFNSIYDEAKLQPGQLRLLDVENPLVIPAGKNIRILTNSTDVIHSFYIPSFGVQRYAIPGRTIETWVRANQPGQYYGECNQVCGTNHSLMPISVRVVTPEEFTTWVKEAKTKFAADVPASPARRDVARLDVAQAADFRPQPRLLQQ